jgi:hypothetical protein
MRPIRLACLLAVLAAPTPLLAQETKVLTTACAAPRPAADGTTAEPDLHGSWDFHMDVGGSPSFGVLSVGWIDGRYGGSLSPVSTAPVVVRNLTLTGRTIRMVVASREGDVTFDGVLSGAGDRMCGTVTYHGGQLVPMVAQKRPQRRYPSAASSPGTSAAPSRGTSAPGGR